MIQRACLWSILDNDSQVSMLNQLVKEDASVGIKLWNLINRDKRVLFIKQIENATLVDVFVKMPDLEDQAHLLSDCVYSLRT